MRRKKSLHQYFFYCYCYFGLLSVCRMYMDRVSDSNQNPIRANRDVNIPFIQSICCTKNSFFLLRSFSLYFFCLIITIATLINMFPQSYFFFHSFVVFIRLTVVLSFSMSMFYTALLYFISYFFFEFFFLCFSSN